MKPKEKTCCICNRKNAEGIKVKTVTGNMFHPGKTKFVCRDCAYILRMLIASHRKVKIL